MENSQITTKIFHAFGASRFSSGTQNNDHRYSTSEVDPRFQAMGKKMTLHENIGTESSFAIRLIFIDGIHFTDGIDNNVLHFYLKCEERKKDLKKNIPY